MNSVGHLLKKQCSSRSHLGRRRPMPLIRLQSLAHRVRDASNDKSVKQNILRRYEKARPGSCEQDRE